jgi:hypothetical protein
MRLHDFTSQNGPMKERHPSMALHSLNSQLECQYTFMSLHDITSQNDPWNIGIHLRDYMITPPRMGLLNFRVHL